MALMDLEARLNGLTQEVGQLTQRVHTLEMGNGAIQNQLNNVTKKLDAQGELLAALKESLDRTSTQMRSSPAVPQAEIH